MIYTIISVPTSIIHFTEQKLKNKRHSIAKIVFINTLTK
jgi:hypothetical protein